MLLDPLPWWTQIGIAFTFGVIIGSFLNVYIYRFHTGKSLAGSSHCLSCGGRLRWFDLFPLFSYVALRGRCRQCSSRIPPRYFLVELLTGLAFVLAFVHTNTTYELIFELSLLITLIIIAVYDLYHLIIPNEFVVVLLALAFSKLGYSWYQGADAYPLLLDGLAALAAASVFAALWYISRGTWLGFGDVKLLLPLALLVGATQVFSLVVFSFWIGAVISVGIMLFTTYLRRGQPASLSGKRRLTMKSEIPFAPFIIASFLVVWYIGIGAVDLIWYVT